MITTHFAQHRVFQRADKDCTKDIHQTKNPHHKDLTNLSSNERPPKLMDFSFCYNSINDLMEFVTLDLKFLYLQSSNAPLVYSVSVVFTTNAYS